MPGETGAPAKLKYASATDEVKLFPAEVNQPQMEEVNTFLKEHILAVKSHSASYNAVSGEFGIQESAGKVTTLPSAATANQVVGVFCGAGAASTKVTTSGGAVLYGGFIIAEATLTLTTAQWVILQSEGTNWLIIGGTPKNEAKYSNKASGESGTPSATRDAMVALTIIGTIDTSIIASVVVGGVSIYTVERAATASASNVEALSFLCPVGQKWELTEQFGIVGCEYSYLLR